MCGLYSVLYAIWYNFFFTFEDPLTLGVKEGNLFLSPTDPDI